MRERDREREREKGLVWFKSISIFYGLFKTEIYKSYYFKSIECFGVEYMQALIARHRPKNYNIVNYTGWNDKIVAREKMT